MVVLEHIGQWHSLSLRSPTTNTEIWACTTKDQVYGLGKVLCSQRDVHISGICGNLQHIAKSNVSLGGLT